MTSESIVRLEALFADKYISMRLDAKTDRRNLSARWNKYIKRYGAELVYNFSGKKKPAAKYRPRVAEDGHPLHTLENLLRLINFKNESVANSVIIKNPDRSGQYLLVPRDACEKILVLGML